MVVCTPSTSPHCVGELRDLAARLRVNGLRQPEVLQFIYLLKKSAKKLRELRKIMVTFSSY